MLLCASSPYSRRGALFDAYARWHGKDDAPVLVWQAATRIMNPTVPQAVIDEALEKDQASAAAEYLAEFRSDLEGFVSLDAVQACIAPGVRERPPQRAAKYIGFCDPSGGSSDSMVLCIAHKEGSTVILDLIREARAPFGPEAIVEEFADQLKVYRCTRVHGDRYAGEWPREQFRKYGINYAVCDESKSELFVGLLPLINSRAVDLLDNNRMITQLVGLERRTGRSGKDSIDHSPGGHDDIANACAGACVLAHRLRGDRSDFSYSGRGWKDYPSTANVGYARQKAMYGMGGHARYSNEPSRFPPRRHGQENVWGMEPHPLNPSWPESGLPKEPE
jgi:hypothetical protein